MKKFVVGEEVALYLGHGKLTLGDIHGFTKAVVVEVNPPAEVPGSALQTAAGHRLD